MSESPDTLITDCLGSLSRGYKELDALYRMAEQTGDKPKAIGHSHRLSTIINATEVRLIELRKLLAVRSERGWIPVTERVPDNDIESLCSDGDHVFFATYALWNGGRNGIKKGNWYETDEQGYPEIRRVTHWMAVPDVPRPAERSERATASPYDMNGLKEYPGE